MAAFNGTVSDLEQLTKQVRDLERRVFALESHPQKVGLIEPKLVGVEASERSPLSPGSHVGIPGSFVPVLGKAILGIAGAYLLRAVAESGIIPKEPMLVVAVAYAGLWMILAAGTRAASHFASATYGITAALIFSPLLWESTVRLRVLSPTVSAVLLVAFVVLAEVLAWPRNLQLIPWLATLAAVITALALIIATQALVPLTAALLAVAFSTEFAVCLGQRLSLRIVSAVAADFAVWLILQVMTTPEGVPPGYHPTGPTTLILMSVGLFGIYGGSIGIRTLGSRRHITFFETIQGTLAAVLAGFGVMRTSHGSTAPGLGVFLLALAGLFYWGAFSRFAERAQARNRSVYATWAAALLVTGSLLLLSARFLVPFLCLAAILSVFAYTRTGRRSLGIHASVYLAAGAALSPFLNYAGNALAGTVYTAPDWRAWMVAVSALISYIVGSRRREGGRREGLLWIVPVGLVAFSGAAMTVAAVARIAGRPELNAPSLSVVRTVVICTAALVFGLLGSRSKRLELGWLAYAAAGFGALKLLLEDFRFGNPASLVASLLIYGLILILLPRLMRRGRSDAPSVLRPL